MRVTLRRGQVGVAEHLLDAAKVGSTLEQMRCEGMPQQVWMNAARLEPGAVGELAKDEERTRPGQGAAACVEEEVGAVATVEMWSPEREIAPHCFDRGTAKRDDALLVALSDHADEAAVEIDQCPGGPIVSETRSPAP